MFLRINFFKIKYEFRTVLVVILIYFGQECSSMSGLIPLSLFFAVRIVGKRKILSNTG